MLITKGSSITETVDSIVSTEHFTGEPYDGPPLLIVEGVDDIQVLQKYYYFYNNGSLPFKVVLGSLDEKMGGKKRALDAYSENKTKFNQVFCLIDRDFDFHLGEESDDKNVFYYDYYELENYLFDSEILKLLFGRFFNCTTIDQYNVLVQELQHLATIYVPYSQLAYFRELHFRGKTEILLSEDGINKFSKIVKIKPERIINDDSLEDRGVPTAERIEKFLEKELSEINLTIQRIKDNFSHDSFLLIAGAREINEESEGLDFFRYFISGKFILGSLAILFKTFTSMRYVNNVDRNSIENTLKNEWIPKNSVMFKQLIESIENEIT
ncbi:hypothetical protein J14TS2_16250 [Bacillus sp. J14TS2]|uniref:DUF4435 domain-containing protein n=1 Tax=Bacillus sp. J14TS2 TaxID=2807188 RepID=UPI001B1356FA|nr:DUF4435 domain-containing protein [Bacillus sp. J14TS2]GIN71150.1 hypothetical protein J14TS2_16250 [Bacillus sp. J14TS2]